MPMDQRFDQFATVQFVVVVGIVHFEVVELQFLFTHFTCIDWNFHMFLDMSEYEIGMK